MKKFKNLKALIPLSLVIAFVLVLNICAATVSEMIENGEISDGPIVFGDERDGVVSDVSSEMSDIGGEISEFARDVLPRTSAMPTDTSDVNMNSDMTPENTMGTSMAEDTASNASLGIVVVVVIAIAVVALIFFFVKRK